jgi:hypothetical protein
MTLVSTQPHRIDTVRRYLDKLSTQHELALVRTIAGPRIKSGGTHWAIGITTLLVCVVRQFAGLYLARKASIDCNNVMRPASREK